MEGSDQEVLQQTISISDSDQLEANTMKQGEGDGSGEPTADDSSENKDVESSGGQQNDNTSAVQEVCTAESVNENVANEPETEFTASEEKEKTSDENKKDETFETSLHLDDSINKDTVVDSELSDIESVITKNSSFKLDSVDLSSLVSLEEELVISDKENDIYIIETEDGNECEQPTSGMFDGTVDPGIKVTGDGSDSGVEVSGCNSCGGRDSSPALLRAFSYNSAGYTSSFGLEDSLTASTATPAASCDSSLISCYSTYEETEDIVTSSTTMMIQVDGDGTSEGGSESSSIASKDARSTSNNTNKKAPSGTNRSSAKKRTLTAEAAKINVDNKSKSTSPTSTPINTCRPKITGHQNPLSASGGAVSKSATRREKIASVMSSSCSAIKSNSQKLLMSGSSTKSSSSSSMSKSVGGTTATLSKARSKDSSMSSSSEGKKDPSSGCSSGTVRGKPVRSSSMRTKVISGTDDGRWPSSANKSHSVTPRSRGVLLDGQSRKLSSSALSTSLMESKASALEKYATLPRRRRCKSPDIPAPVLITIETPLRSHSVSRDPSLNRAASLRKQHYQRDGSHNKSLPPYPRRRFHKTVIYHETSSQTALTANDVEKALAGIPVRESVPIDAVETQEQEVQVDRRMEDLEHLESQLKILTEDSQRQREELSVKEQQLEQEKADRLRSSQHLLAMLRSAKGDHLEENDTVDTLQALETYLQTSSHVVIKQQQEISELQTLCRTLKRDLEKSLAAQKTLLQQQQELEAESIELQEFLQAEKSTLAEALKDAETEIKGQKQQLSQKESELERQQEECKHLVRISEQRRQENLALQARLCSLEQRSRELLLQQGAAVSGAAVALSGLSSRLDGLVEQLVVSYNISEKDLEVVAALLVSSSAAVGGGSVGGGGDGGGAGRESADVIYHNEAYSKSNSSVEASPEKVSANKQSEKPSFDAQRTPSPKRGASFVSAVISAIRNATAGGMAKQGEPQTEETSVMPEEAHEERTQVPEPEEDATSTVEQDSDEIASNPRYSTGSISASCLANSESLQNLSQAILNRQHFELAQAEGTDDIAAIEYESSGVDLLPPLENCSPAITLVDQIIDVDNLVTKLLKVLRIIQLENDTCVDELHDERIQLAEQVRREQESRREVQDEVRNWERMGARLRGEVQDVRLQLQRRVQELEQTKRELEQHRDQIQELTRELNSLSVVCKETEMQLLTHEQEAENVLQQWQQSGQLPSPEILARVITAREEVPVLKKKLAEKEQQLQEIGQKYSLSKQMLTENWSQAATEVQRQYEAIDSALETLHSVQGVVMQCPPLAKLQQDLEETNFQSASSLPLLAADLNANAPPLVTLNGTHNGGNNSTHKSGNTINGTA